METFDKRGRRRWSGKGPERLGGPRRRRRTARKRGGRRDAVGGGRSESVLSRRRRRATPALLLVAVLVIAAAAGGAWWWNTRTAALAVTAWPEDAIVTFEGIDYIGDCALEELEPGTYTVCVARKGFEPYETTIELARLRTTELEPRLHPLPQPLAVSSNPAGADYRIEASDGTVLVGQTPYEGELPAGPTVVTLSMAGYNEYRRELMLETTETVSLWLDPEGQIVHCLDVWESGPAPKGAAFTPDGSQVWVSFLAGPPSVQVFETATGDLLDEFTLDEHGAVEVVFSPDGSRAYVSQMETARVYEIDAATREVLRTFDTESAWTKMMELFDGMLYASNWSGDDVSEIDLATGETVRRLPTVDTPRGMHVTADGAYLYVAGFGGGDIDKVSLADGSRTTVYSEGVAVRHFACDEEAGLLYASDMGTDEILVVDLTTDEVRTLCETDEKPNTIDISPDGRVLFVSCRGENNAASYYLPGPEWGSILLIDTASGEPLDAIVGGNQPTALDVSDDGTQLVFSDFLDDRLRLYEIPSYETLADGDGGLYEAHFDMIRK
jgi:DNA-binding beta-propeller fold protein YncE